MVSEIKDLLNRFNSLKKSEVIEMSNNVQDIKELIQKFTPFLEQIKEEERRETPHYNIFKVLKIEYLEASVHTPFLADLLNPRGNHSQGELFLDAFFRIIADKKLAFLNIDYNNIQIKNEYFTTKGIIDILILNNDVDSTNRFVVIIENKIFASDQEDQLKRYYDYALNDLKLSEEQIKIIYLKPSKGIPSSRSLSEDDFHYLVDRGILKLLGYNPDILHMLFTCNKKVVSEKLRQTIFQYIEVIKEFNYG